MSGAAYSRWWATLKKSVWFFPVCLALSFIILTAFKISGSSIGSYYPVFYGAGQKDPSLILNHPAGIRSDEWLVTTQLTIAQHAAGYPRVNPNIDSGHDMSVVGDAPYKDWSELFRPQNLIFFVLPFEFAFAFKWWLLLFLTITSLYFLVLRFFPGRRLFAAMLGTAFGCSPFLFWWYSSGTFGPIFYAAFIIILGLRIIGNETVRVLPRRLAKLSTAVHIVALGYVLSCFALILYPPFQIPIAMVIGAFLLGTFIQKFEKQKQLISKTSMFTAGSFAVSGLLALAVILTFLHTRPSVINAISNSVYPGHRLITGGYAPLHVIFDTYLQPQLQRSGRAVHYYNNQSEASNFILLLPFLFLPAWHFILLKYRRMKQIDWQLLFVQLICILFLFNLFVPHLQFLYHLAFLDRGVYARLFIGLGFLGIIQLLLLARGLFELELPKRQLLSMAKWYSLLSIAIIVIVGLYNRSHYPGFIHSYLLLSFLGIFFVEIIYFLLSLRLTLAAALLLIFTGGSVFHIHPLYRGLGPIYNSSVTKAIDEVSKPGQPWAVTDNLLTENFALISNRESISGVKPYPELKFWGEIVGQQDKIIYDRYAHVLFNSDPAFSKNLALTGPDSFQIKFGCTNLVQKYVKFALATHPIVSPCVKEIRQVNYPAITFYLYSVKPAF